LLKRDEIFKTVIPTKMLEFMSCARPVILGVDGHARKIIKDAAAGIFIRPASEDDLTAAVIRLAQDNQLRTTLGRNGRKFILQFYSRRQTAKKYAAFLEALIGDQPKAEAAA
jgi:glycosyltransferase involved in cell wall biosynthesis